MDSNHLLCTGQHGFVHGRSCITQKLIAMDYWARHLNRLRNSCRCMCLNFRKTFDAVQHTHLLTKLQPGDR